LSAADVAKIREQRARGIRCNDIATAFGVSTSLVTQIARGKIWKAAGGFLTKTANIRIAA